MTPKMFNVLVFTFHFRFSDKTRNEWEDKDCFEKVQGKYDLLKMDYEASSQVLIEILSPCMKMYKIWHQILHHFEIFFFHILMCHSTLQSSH